MKVSLEIQRELHVDLPYDKVITLFDDLEATISRFPKLRNLKQLDEDSYLWEMRPIGSRTAGIAHEVVYAARYDVAVDEGVIAWKGLPQHGNALISGSFKLRPNGGATALEFSVNGELRDVPVPLIYRMLAPPFIQGKFTRLVDGFLERTRDALMAKPTKAKTAAKTTESSQTNGGTRKRRTTKA